MDGVCFLLMLTIFACLSVFLIIKCLGYWAAFSVQLLQFFLNVITPQVRTLQKTTEVTVSIKNADIMSKAVAVIDVKSATLNVCFTFVQVCDL